MKPSAYRRGEAPLLTVEDLCHHFPIHSGGLLKRQIGTIRAVDQLNLKIYPGETLGLVGESGAGKTTAGRCIARALTPTSGSMLLQRTTQPINLAALSERDLLRLGPQAQIVFLESVSSLDPRLTVGEIVAEPLVLHKVARGAELLERVVEMLVKVGLKPDDPGRFLSAFPEAKRQRVAVARALILRPALVVVDEALTALNLAVQLDTANLLRDLQHEFRLPCLFITRDLRLARRLCDRIAVMYAGRVVEIGTGEEIFTSARHPYTRALVATIPSLNPDIRTGSPLDGPPVDTADLPPGCPFHPRCPAAQPGLCDRPGHPPELERLPHGGAAACFRAEELAEEEPLRSGSPL